MPTAQYVLSIVTAAGVVAMMAEMLRRRQLREKYAVLWLAVGVVVAVLSVFPQLLGWLAGSTDVAVPLNLLFFLAIILLLGVSMHLSWESSRLEEKCRTLAEEVALLSLQVSTLQATVEAADLADTRTPTPADARRDTA
jgi:hypothetical protein